METLLPAAVFAFVGSITPGPNNIMLTSSGILFGFRRTIPHILGVNFGFGVLLALCALSVGSLVLAVPAIGMGLKALGSGYLLYLAWGLLHMRISEAGIDGARPMSFMAATLFQFANPKAWFLGVSGASAFLPSDQPVALAIFLLCLVFCAVNLPCIGLWAGAGAVLRRYLLQPLWQRLFKVTMAALTLYCAVSLWL